MPIYALLPDMIDREPISEDFNLLDQLRQGDEKAFAALYHTYWQSLLNAAIHRLGTIETAQEVVQDVFTSIWQRRETLVVTTSVAAYLHTALKYKVLDYLRAQKVKDKYVQSIKQKATAYSHSTAETVALHELDHALHQGIKQLPEKCRLIFSLSRFEHHSTQEIATELHISPKTVENQIGKALRLLRVSMKEFLSLVACLLSFF